MFIVACVVEVDLGVPDDQRTAFLPGFTRTWSLIVISSPLPTTMPSDTCAEAKESSVRHASKKRVESIRERLGALREAVLPLMWRRQPTCILGMSTRGMVTGTKLSLFFSFG